MKVFLDTNILYEDYFFRNKFNAELLSIAEEHELTLYLSRIVILELRQQYKDELAEKQRQLNRLLKDSGRLKITTLPEYLIDEEAQLAEFDKFYKSLEDEQIITVLEPVDSDLSEVIRRYTNKLKPFSKGKDEFKDTLIWLHYSRESRRLDEDECYLLTGNTSDFCDKKEKSKIHKDLISDSDKFKVYNSTHNFFREKSSEISEIPIRFSLYIEDLNVDSQYLSNFLEHNYFDQIWDHIIGHINEASLEDIFDDDHWEFVPTGYIETDGMDITDCIDFDLTIIKDKALITGTLGISAEVAGYSYNSVRDPGDPRHSYAGSSNIDIEVDFSLTLLSDEIIEDVEIDNFRIV